MISVILCGGAGSRLWPLSREMYPKPFLHLPGGLSLIQHSVETAAILPEVKEIIIIANAKLRANMLVEVNAVKSHVPVPVRYIYEPVGRNTAAAVCTAALDVAGRYGEDEPMQILAADHLIGDVEALGGAVEKALSLATAQDKLVTYGITPTRPETGYGYIHHQGDQVLQFVEKPSLNAAKTYLADGGYLWNSGMFCFKSGTILREMREHSPQIVEATEKCCDVSFPDAHGNEVVLDHSTFNRVPSNSIDYAVMEKSKNIAVVPCSFGWNDIGSWLSLSELYPSNQDHNRVIGDSEPFFIGSRNCTIHASDKVVAVIGMKDTLIADTGDALLVAAMDKTQEVRQVYDALKKRKHESSVIHLQVKPPWGEFKVLHQGKGYKVKRLLIKSGQSISLQSHEHRNETWTAVAGEGNVYRDEKVIAVKPGNTVFIPACAKHRVECTSEAPLEIIEVQMGDYLGEDDITRYKDAYGREPI